MSADDALDERKDFLGRGWAMPVAHRSAHRPRRRVPSTRRTSASRSGSSSRPRRGERVMRPELRLRHPRPGVRRARQHDAAADPLARSRRRCAATKRASRCSSVIVDEDATRRGQAAGRDRIPRAPDQPDRQSRLPVLLPRGGPAVKPLAPPRTRDRGARRSSQRELLERARAWVPSWGSIDDEGDFGTRAARDRRALQLGGRGTSRRRGRQDARAASSIGSRVRGEAARPARMPVVFKLAETAREPVAAAASDEDAGRRADATVIFETETDVRVVPGAARHRWSASTRPRMRSSCRRPDLSSLEPLEPLPTQWRLKSFAAPGARNLQLDPGLGLVEGMLGGDRRRAIPNPASQRTISRRSIPRFRRRRFRERRAGRRRSRRSILSTVPVTSRNMCCIWVTRTC